MRSRLWSWWNRYEGPTLLLAVVIYAAWFALTWFHARLQWWEIIPLGAFIIAWHASLQHETIHALVNVPRPLRLLIAWPPLGLGYPFGIYYRDHRKHHRNEIITDPTFDPESFYIAAEVWRRYPAAVRALLLVNQTVLGRLTLGAPLSLAMFGVAEFRRVLGGDRSNVADWLRHAVAAGVLFVWVCGIAHMAWWQYIAWIALPGLCLGMLRTFIEHRAAPNPKHRTAIVENDLPFGVIFLYNNLHAVHHESPAMPWYKIRGDWKRRREQILARNGGFYFAGYGTIVRRWLLRPVFLPSLETERVKRG